MTAAIKPYGANVSSHTRADENLMTIIRTARRRTILHFRMLTMQSATEEEMWSWNVNEGWVAGKSSVIPKYSAPATAPAPNH